MATIIQFEELEIWKEARSMNRVIWKLTSRARLVRYPFMQDQLRRASLSVMNNISEGFERDGNAEFVQFLSIAKGSVGELRNMFYVLLNLELITEFEFEELSNQNRLLGNKIRKLMKYLRASEFKGPKYKK